MSFFLVFYQIMLSQKSASIEKKSSGGTVRDAPSNWMDMTGEKWNAGLHYTSLVAANSDMIQRYGHQKLAFSNQQRSSSFSPIFLNSYK